MHDHAPQLFWLTGFGLLDLGTLPGHPVAVVDLVLIILGVALVVAARHVRRMAGAQEVQHA